MKTFVVVSELRLESSWLLSFLILATLSAVNTDSGFSGYGSEPGRPVGDIRHLLSYESGLPLDKPAPVVQPKETQLYGPNPEAGSHFEQSAIGPTLPPTQRTSSYVKFFLYPNPWDWEEEHEIVTDDVQSLDVSGFNRSLPVTLLIHGMLADRFTFFDVLQIKNAYLQTQYPTNAIMVDYGKLAVSKLPYVLSPLSILRMGWTLLMTEKLVTEMLDFVYFLMKNGVLRGPEDLHMVGFSNGGFLNRRVAKRLFTTLGRRTKRLTVLEGGGENPLRARSSERYADFIDYTVTSQGALSLLDREWDVQFFINGGGLHQPTCPNWVPLTESYCSHASAVFYFARSVRRRDIKSCKCNSKCLRPPRQCVETVPYGQHTPVTARGRYYVRLN